MKIAPVFDQAPIARDQTGGRQRRSLTVRPGVHHFTTTVLRYAPARSETGSANIEFGRLCSRRLPPLMLEMLHHVRHIDRRPIEPDLGQRLL